MYSKIAIIGGGPAGLAAAKSLAMEPVSFSSIVVYERGDDVGGLWNYNNTSKQQMRPPIPSTRSDGREKWSGDGSPFILSMHRHLETNLQVKLMEFSNVPFEGRDFPNRHRVYNYLKQYSASLGSGVNLKFRTNVECVNKDGGYWHVTATGPQGKSVSKYDAVIVCNGHFELPFIPEVLGLSEWSTKDPVLVSHARYFVDSEVYRGKRVLIVGNLWLGIDVATQVAVVAAKVWVSARTPEKVIVNPLVTEIGVVSHYDVMKRSAKAPDGTIEGIDAIIFCTGYLFLVPFLKTYAHIVSEFHVRDLYHQVFYLHDPSLSFLCLQKNVVPMPLAEAQAAILARVYSGRIVLPTVAEMEDSVAKDTAARGSRYHIFGYPDDVDFYQLYYALLEEHPETMNQGLIPPIWDKEKIEIRRETGGKKIARLKEIFAWAESLRKEGKPFSLAPPNTD